MKKLFIETYGCQMNVADSEVGLMLIDAQGAPKHAASGVSSVKKAGQNLKQAGGFLKGIFGKFKA
jgi:tRNA A37 methylthiotransferase MiaB